MCVCVRVSLTHYSNGSVPKHKQDKTENFIKIQIGKLALNGRPCT